MIAKYIADAEYVDLPGEAIQATKQHILHTLAALIGGSGTPGCKIVVDQVKDWGGKEESTILVYGGKVPAIHAVLANATMAHALDFCMNDDRTYYKSSVVVVPACLSVAEQEKVTGKELLTGTCLGIELGIRIALAINPKPAHGLSPSIGCLASAAGVGKILGLDEEQLADALGISFCQATNTGTSTFSPSLTKRLGPGLAGRAGVFSASLAARGFKGTRNVLQGPKGYYCSFHGLEGDQRELASDWGSRFEIVNVGPKGYPGCRRLHAPIEAALAVAEEYDVKAQDITEVIVQGAARELFPPGSEAEKTPLQKRYHPENVVDAQFSIPWGVATALLKRKVFIEDFTEEAITSPEVIRMASKVVLQPNDELESKDTMICPAVVTVKTQGGLTFSKRVDFPKGNSRNPVSWEETKDTFRECATYAARPLPEENVEQVVNIIDNLEDTRDVSQLARLLY